MRPKLAAFTRPLRHLLASMTLTVHDNASTLIFSVRSAVFPCSSGCLWAEMMQCLSRGAVRRWA